MDKRVIRNKKNKSRNVRPYDRPNQGILGKVASKVKDLFTPSSWNLNVLQWMSTPQEQPGSSNDPDDESADEDEVSPQATTSMSSTTHGNKRPRLTLHEHTPSILRDGTQTWLDAPSSSNLFNQSPHLPSAVMQNTLVENKESPIIMNGDDHSENSEGSASTSGCSSLVSSHKERSNCLGPSNLRLNETALANLRGTLKNTVGLKIRKDLTSRKEGFTSPNTSASRLSMWSGSPVSKFQQRSPSVGNSSQPGFNVSAFVAPSKVNQQMERKVASPFYQGRTSFGGASSTRKLPVSTAPYQVERSLRNQIKVRSNQPEDSLEGMSSAAKRILLTLEKMSSPVTDAKKIPNTNKSPVDLSLYMMPPKHRSNVVSTPAGTPKGPPIANISTISKLTTLKSCGVRKFQNSAMESLPVPSEEKIKVPTDIFQSDLLPSPLAKGGGGGKIKSKIHQQHQPSAASSSLEQLESVSLPNVPLPISTLPTFSFGPKIDKSSENINKLGNDFVFSSPIEVLPKVPVHNNISVPHLDSNLERSSVSQEKQAFTFSSPIEIELPSAILGGVFSSNSSSTWECASCWVRNSANDSKCVACESSKPSLNTTEPKLSMANTPATKPLSEFKVNFGNSPSTWKCNSCWIQNPSKEAKCMACETPKSGAPTSKSTSASIPRSDNGTAWDCGECWVNNPAKQLKCLACETPKPGQASNPSVSSSSAFFGNSSVSFKLPNIPSLDSSNQTVTFGGVQLSADKPSQPNKSVEKTSDIFASKRSDLSKSSSKNSDLSTLENIAKSVCTSKDTDSTSTLNGHNKVSISTNKLNVENTVSNREKTNSNFSFKTVATSQSPLATTFGGKPLSVSNPAGSWECDTCLVRNTAEKQKCVACETLRPSKKNMSGLKDPESLKFSSPLQGSPITFKFNSSSNSQTTAAVVTTSTVTFGSSSLTGGTFFTPVSSTATSVSTEKEPKAPSLTETSTPKSVPEFKFDAPKVPLLDASKPQIPIIDLANEKENTDAKSIFSIPESKSSSEGSTLPTVTTTTSSSSSSFFKTASPVIKSTVLGTLTPIASTEKDKSFLPVPEKTVTLQADSHQTDSKKVESVSSGLLKDAPLPVGGFNFKIPSSSASAFGGFGVPTSTTDSKLTSQAKSLNAENKPDPPAGVNVSAAPLSTTFSLPTSTPMFKAETVKTSEASAVKNVFASALGSSSSTTTTTTTATPTFNFSSTPISVGTTGLTPTTSQPSISLTSTQTFGNLAKSQDKKSVASATAFTAATTQNAGPIKFGTTTATTQSNPSSGFSFFTSSAANTTPSNTPNLFVFGNANSAQTSTIGGFTFKGLNEDKPTPAPSNALNFNTPVTNSSTSSLFKFNATAPTSSASGFVFGAVKSEPGTVSASTSTFGFGSGGAQSTNSTFSGFQTNPSVTPSFQFGSQPATNTVAAPTFGSGTNTFTFGKTESTNQLPTTQAPSGFGVNMQPMFGGAAAPAPTFGKTEKPAFNFGMPQGSSTPVFQFGEKKQATGPQFSFGTPAQENPAPASGPSFSNQFNFNATPNFNFGAASTQSGPFQFAASTDSQSSAPRKIRKAVRRGPRKD